ncbi:hypothetical protein K450DRAFT_228266 [Umbelopsis ramanniana AG]|uniref:Uncharacterized protein n=1 Tax=Umbelopsis ramanniana AG TaxID=1314678 RepID=A0AAD5EE98_UMBRA|nr:uncharacterized protein K450DRAFT_228266 [Umbelopsis ramanniana AG]KAI8582291.1 hypothetical protein K450DRAFT_228266 [Umbelopsis ramanniana AG]
MPESSATSKPTKNLVANIETSTEVKKTSAAAEKTTEKKTTAAETKQTTAAAKTSGFQNADTTTTKAATSTHAAASTHSSSSTTVSSKVASSSVLPIIVSTPSSSLATTTSASALPTSTTADSSSSGSPSVAGPVVGSIAGIAVVGAIAFFFIRRRNKNKKTRATHAFSQFLNEAPPHHGTGNVRDSMWGMPAKADEKDVNNGYAISPPPPLPEKAYNPDFGSPPPMSPPTAYSAYDPQQHVNPNAAAYGGPSPQAEYGNVSPSHMDHNAAIAGAAVAGAAVGGAIAHQHHQQQYPNEVNGDMPLSDPYKQPSPQSPQQQQAADLGEQQQNAYYQQQSPQQQHPDLAGQQNAYYQQSPQQQHIDVNGQQNAYYSPPQEFQQQPGVGYNQPYPGYQQGYQQEAQQYYDPNAQQYGYSAQPYSQYNSMYIGAEHSYFQDDPEYANNYPAVAAATAFGQPSHNAPEQQQHSYEMMPQPSLTQPPTADQAESVPTTSQPEPSRDVQTPNSITAPNSVTPAPTLLTNDIGQSTPSTEHYVDHTTPAEQQPSQSEPANPYVLDVPIEYNNDPARETLYGLSEHYQYGGDDKDDGQELSSGHQTTQPPPPHPPAHKGDLM